MEEKRYSIGGKNYFLRPLVLGQWQQLLGLLEGVRVRTDMTAGDVIGLCGKDLHRALAIVLRDETPLKSKDIEAWAETLAFEATPEQALEVVRDFFDLNPISSLTEGIGTLMRDVAARLSGTGSSNSASSAQPGTSPEKGASSGA